MRQSESIKDIVAAVIKMQSTLKGASKDSFNPHFKAKYADLESIWDAIREPLTANGLCVIQTTGFEQEHLGVITTIAHTSGQFITGFFPIVTEKSNNPQAVGSATTYARRFALAAICGVHQTDDDGNESAPKFNKPIRKETYESVAISKPIVNYASEPQRKMLFASSRSAGMSDLDLKALLKTFGYESSKEIRSTDVNLLKEKIDKFKT